MTITFYSTIDQFGDFCNFAKFGIEMDGKWYSTVEHYYQAMKFDDTSYQEKIRLAYSPKDAKAFAYDNRNLRSDWDEVKDDIMYRAVLKNFQTHDSLKQRLLATGDEDIVENAPGDYYWGCGAY